MIYHGHKKILTMVSGIWYYIKEVETAIKTGEEINEQYREYP